MAITQNTFTGNGSNLGPFSFTFKWLESTDIKVTVAGVLKTVGTHYNLQGLNYATKSGGQVLFTAGNAPANGAAIVIYRQTDDADLVSTFYSGSAIRSQDLNDNFTQILYVSQETQAFAASTDASAIQGQVTAAVNTANTANANATTALSTANAASTTANGIAATANTALSTAQAAETTANGIAATANSASTTANAALARSGGTMTGAINFVSGQAYPQVPQNTKTSAYTLLATDAGKHVSITTGGITVPSGVFAVGDAISIYNNSGSSQTITQGASTTLRLAGTSLTSNRTLAQYGLCSVLCVASNTFVITGTGVS
jgi:hypothetical protein